MQNKHLTVLALHALVKHGFTANGHVLTHARTLTTSRERSRWQSPAYLRQGTQSGETGRKKGMVFYHNRTKVQRSGKLST